MLEQHALLLTHIVVFAFTMFQFGKLSNITEKTNAQLLQRKYHASVQSLVMQDCSGTARFTGYLQISNTRKNSRNVGQANAQRDGRPAKYRWRPLFNAAKFG